MNRAERSEYAGAVVALLIGGGAVLLLSTRDWQTVVTPRPRPFAADVLGLTGRALDAAPTALSLVALAGVVAVIATRGLARRVIGALVSLAGLELIWRCASAIATVGTARAEQLVRAEHPRVASPSGAAPTVAAHPAWGVLSVVAAVLVLAAGLLITIRGSRWGAMSARYEAPAGARDRPVELDRDIDDDIDVEQERARADASLWSALERGEDPTARDPQAER